MEYINREESDVSESEIEEDEDDEDPDYRPTPAVARSRYPLRRLHGKMYIRRRNKDFECCKEVAHKLDERTGLSNSIIKASKTQFNTAGSRQSSSPRKLHKNRNTLTIPRFNPEQVQILMDSYSKSPYPDRLEKFRVSDQAGLTLIHVQSWFAQRRMSCESKQKCRRLVKKRDVQPISQFKPSEEEILLDFFRNRNPLPIPQEILDLSKSTGQAVSDITAWFERKRNDQPDSMEDDANNDDEGSFPTERAGNSTSSSVILIESESSDTEMDKSHGSQNSENALNETQIQETMMQLGKLSPSILEDMWPEIETCLIRLVEMSMEDANSRHLLEEDSDFLNSILMHFNLTFSSQNVIIDIHNSKFMKKHREEIWLIDQESDQGLSNIPDSMDEDEDDTDFISNVLNPWAIALLFAKLSQQTVVKSLKDLEMNCGFLERQWTIPDELDNSIALKNSI